MLGEGVKALLNSRDPYCFDYFVTGQEGYDYLTQRRILVIGAGGLGCELLKCLAMYGFKSIDVIDMDRIDLSNLNRQFLFREKDVNNFKSVVAANYIMSRIPDCHITAHTCRIQELPQEFYEQFDVIIGGLDNREARLWLNDTVVKIALEKDIVIPYIDGGTESWGGQVKVIIPLQTPCMRCQNTWTPQTKFQFCTIANNPRQPEHCVAWAMDKAWKDERPDEKLDGDNDNHVQWIVEKANAHAQKCGLVCEITPFMAKGVIKGIIPSIASTQSITASMCATECLKYITGSCANAARIQSDGANGITLMNIPMKRNEKCQTCNPVYEQVEIGKDKTIKDLLEILEAKRGEKNLQLIHDNGTHIYLRMFSNTKANIDKNVTEFFQDGDKFLVPPDQDKKYQIIFE